MYELKIRDYCFVAHSLKDEFFGPAKKTSWCYLCS